MSSPIQIVGDASPHSVQTLIDASTVGFNSGQRGTNTLYSQEVRFFRISLRKLTIHEYSDRSSCPQFVTLRTQMKFT